LPDGNDGNSAISSPLFHLSNKIFNNLSNKEKNKENHLMTARTSSWSSFSCAAAQWLANVFAAPDRQLTKVLRTTCRHQAKTLKTFTVF